MLARVGLNVLHISESDTLGGAARAAQRLHRGLEARGHVSRMLVGRKVSSDPNVRSVKRSNAWRAADRSFGGMLDSLGLQYVAYPSSFGIPRDPWFREADLLQLHNLHGSYFGFSALPGLTRRRPAVWLLHDQWALTGHVAYSLDCERWRHGCGSCPHLHDYPRLPRDTTRLLWRLKDAVYRRSRLALVVPSRWLLELVRASPLLSRFPVHRIPHGIDTEVFRPAPKAESRRRLGLPEDREIVFFAASDLTEPRKGLHLLERALHGMEAPPLLILAGGGRAAPDVEHRHLGHVDDDGVLAAAYAAADVVAVPSLADALNLTAVESISCGTPCVAFDRGGVTDVVRHLGTGYVAKFGDAADFARGVRAVLDEPVRFEARCRAVAEEEFTLELQLQRYLDLYELVLGE